ncbi:MAG: SCO family protein [Thiotrichales bacterium]|jgi:protein SCO1/2|nr:SCO family protein [Thiotrichales bacterium]
MKKLYIIYLLIIATLGVALAVWMQNHQKASHAVLISNEAPTGGDFTLTGPQGVVSLHDFSGKVVLLYFGYTTCPDICPTNLGNLAEAMHLLTPEEQNQVQVLMITVDPERDTQEKLATYLPYFDKHFIGLTGTPEQIAEVARRYGAVYQKAAIGEGALGYAVDHSAFTYLINQQGKLIQQLPHATTGSEFVQAIRALFVS